MHVCYVSKTGLENFVTTRSNLDRFANLLSLETKWNW